MTDVDPMHFKTKWMEKIHVCSEKHVDKNKRIGILGKNVMLGRVRESKKSVQ